MADWNAAQYLKFEDERTRPSVDLLARVRHPGPKRAVDLGCGPGNSTELLVQRYPETAVEGFDSSPDMLEKARKRLPGVAFTLGDIDGWRPAEPCDVIFANAVMQWLPDHRRIFPQLVQALAPGGVLAVQMPNNLDEPSHRLMRETAADGPWAAALAGAAEARTKIESFETYYGLLQGAGCAVDIWQTTYVHPLQGPAAIVEWLKSTGLRPFLDPLDAEQQRGFLDAYLRRIVEAYPTQADGKVLLRFPRLFIVAQRG
ncbi:trans-aconitate 2-methyltransferase [Alsobacter soli]|uniref:Trans-aconitate 2-methyltransferase n=1 Tax=Alsobacter soli TaxID=2109933 RepID=A0A2T1HYF6_9HYPH|nr:trans-aconitate 2-methyltransferase [Alsobacter soli]PSC06701.1 trans-aconitate 2-methyltransferase [Alsobacter soli]